MASPAEGQVQLTTRRDDKLWPALQAVAKGAAWPALILLLAFCFPGFAYAQSPAGQASTSDAATVDALLLDVGDLLDVRVFDTPELSEKLRVDDRGEIVLPVGGVVSVKGLTAEQAQTAIEQRFRRNHILHDPHVEVFVLEYATQGVTVAGEVKTPGVYPWVAKQTVLGFISVAGGVTASASKTVTVSRKQREQVITFQLNNSPQGNGGDIDVQPGDRILVTRAGVVYVVGDVGRPGGYLIENTDTVTVLQALALAQGINKTAKYDARLIRNSPSGRTESDLPLKRILANQAADPKLQDGDILFVPVSGSKQWADKSMTSVLQMAVGVVIYGRL
ncbi:MAG: polysaccharide biosynthesis/export family protein [Candidatus Korobacteraceae bacterium]|jgi:polysaccharide export outer membrane protein